MVQSSRMARPRRSVRSRSRVETFVKRRAGSVVGLGEPIEPGGASAAILEGGFGEVVETIVETVDGDLGCEDGESLKVSSRGRARARRTHALGVKATRAVQVARQA